MSLAVALKPNLLHLPPGGAPPGETPAGGAPAPGAPPPGGAAPPGGAPPGGCNKFGFTPRLYAAALGRGLGLWPWAAAPGRGQGPRPRAAAQAAPNLASWHWPISWPLPRLWPWPRPWLVVMVVRLGPRYSSQIWEAAGICTRPGKPRFAKILSLGKMESLRFDTFPKDQKSIKYLNTCAFNTDSNKFAAASRPQTYPNRIAAIFG